MSLALPARRHGRWPSSPVPNSDATVIHYERVTASQAPRFQPATGFVPVSKPKVYIETTIPSYLAAMPSRDVVTLGHQQITREWWEISRARFDLYVSDLVLEECARGDSAAASRRLSAIARFRSCLLPNKRTCYRSNTFVVFHCRSWPVQMRSTSRSPCCTEWTS